MATIEAIVSAIFLNCALSQQLYTACGTLLSAYSIVDTDSVAKASWDSIINEQLQGHPDCKRTSAFSSSLIVNESVFICIEMDGCAKRNQVR